MKEETAFKDGLCSGCHAMGLDEPDSQALERLYRYYKELKHWNKRINLIAKKATDSEILEKHFLDSLTLLPELTGEHPHLLDIGTGAGFPGLVCKAVKPDLKLTLVEPRLKRVSFLSHISRMLQLSDVTILECRAEDTNSLPSETAYTHICSRAVSEIKVFLAMSSRFMKLGTQVVCMKGPRWEEELKLWEDEPQRSSQFSLCSRKTYTLPHSQGIRHLLIFGNYSASTRYLA